MTTSNDRVRPVQFSTIPGGATSKSRGYADGYAHGWAAGMKAANEEAKKQTVAWKDRCAQEECILAQRVERALAVLSSATDAANARLAPVLDGSTEALVRGAVDLAEAVLGVELSDHGVALRAALSRALSLEGADQVVRVRLNPDDLAALDAVQSTPESVSLPEDLELVADPSLNPGDALSELPEGMLDGRIDQAVARVREALDVHDPRGDAL